MKDKPIRTIEATDGEIVLIRWFLPKEGGYYEETRKCPTKQNRRNSIQNETRNRRSPREDSN